MSTAWIGLGRMGRPMVTNLITKGFAVSVQNRSQGKVQELVGLGAQAGQSFAGMAAEATTIHTCLPDIQTVQEVMTGKDGILAGSYPGLVIVDHSTIHPEVAQNLAELAQSVGASFLDAPVSGSGPLAEQGQLTIMVGGNPHAFEIARPAMEAMGSTVRLVGPSGSGSLTKIVNNVMMATNLAVAFEATLLGIKHGLDPDAMYEVVRTASGASRTLDRNIPRALAGSFPRDGGIGLTYKDLELASKLAIDAELPMPVADAGRAFWLRAINEGIGDQDPAYGVTIVEKDAGIDSRSKR